MSHQTNPDSRPLPNGWVSEYSPEWNSWYYVNTKDANPQAVWHHPNDNESHAATAATSSIPAPSNTGSAPPGPTITPTPTNTDTRPLPDGWISEYSTDHKTFFYVNTKATDPGSTVTWSHPADNHSQPPAAPAAATGAKENPDKRPLPPGWITDYAENFGAWYYVNTRDPAGGSVWTHPADVHPQLSTPSTPAAASSSAAPPAGSQPAPSYQGNFPEKVAASLPGSSAHGAIGSSQAHENPDKRPLPAGWISKFDEGYKTWYYVDTTKPGGPASWEHPADKQAATPASAPAPVPSAPGGSRPVQSNTNPGATPGGAQPQNPDKRPLPAGWVTQYDRNTSKWFYIKTTEHPPITSWKHPADGTQPMSPGQTPTPGAHQAPAGAPPGATAGGAGKGLEGLLGAKAGGMVGGFLGSKARGQIDGFADIIGGEINKFKQQRTAGNTGVPAPSQAPPGPAPSQYQAPAGQAPSQYVPPPAGQPPASATGGLSGKFGFGKK